MTDPAKEELRELIREAHAAAKDLRTASKEAQQMSANIRRNAEAHIHRTIKTALDDGLAQYKLALSEAVRTSTKRINRRFDSLLDVMLGEDKNSRMQGLPSLVDLARLAKAADERDGK